ncbi:MAG TPA: hypothetical protein VN736_05385 [Candidatus Limnocylindrales bacterium]|nr:hypothetical protein [Candidatus Limnocylindrales bacterium]
MHPLAGVCEKLRRADVHIVSLYNEIIAYTNDSPYALAPHRDLGNGKAGFKFHIIKEPPLYLSTIIGDAVNNLRCSLDYMAHELTIANRATPDRQTQFPIALTEPDFINQVAGLGKLNRASVKAIKIASCWQPYRLDEDKRTTHPLFRLAKLSNLDKHHALALCATGGFVNASFIHPDGRIFISELKDGLIHDGAVVASFPVDAFDEKIKTQISVSTRVAFKDAPVANLEALNVVQSIREFIGELILPGFEPFFDPLPDELRIRPKGVLMDIIKPIVIG